MQIKRFTEDCDKVQEALDKTLDSCRYLVREVAARELQPKIYWFCHFYGLKFDAGIGRFLNGWKIVDPDYQSNYPPGAREGFHEALVTLDNLLMQEVFEGEELYSFLQDYDGTPSTEAVPQELVEIAKWAAGHGRVVEYGPHSNGVGFYVSCKYPGSPCGWVDSGHGHTLQEAAEHALILYRGGAYRFKSSSEFGIDR